MKAENLTNLIFSFALLYYSVFFRRDYYLERYPNNKLFKSIFYIDSDKLLNLFFNKSRREVFIASNKLAFWVCIIMAILTGLNGILAFLFDVVPNVSVIFITIGFLGSWIIKCFFVFSYKDKQIKQIPKFLLTK